MQIFPSQLNPMAKNKMVDFCEDPRKLQAYIMFFLELPEVFITIT